MKKLLAIVVLGLIIAGYYFYDENKRIKKATAVCEEHYKTSDQRCIDDYFFYHYHAAKKAAKKNWPEYKKEVDEILNKIDDLNNKKPNIDLIKYNYASAKNIYDSRIITRKKLRNKKIIIGEIWSGGFFEPSCSNWRKYDYYVCMKQSVYNEDGDDINKTFEVEIVSMDDFPDVKEIIDKLNSYNFSIYNKTVYGELSVDILIK